MTIRRTGLTEELHVSKDFERVDLDADAKKALDHYAAMSAYELELLSTLDFLHRAHQMNGEKLVEELREIKPQSTNANGFSEESTRSRQLGC